MNNNLNMNNMNMNMNAIYTLQNEKTRILRVSNIPRDTDLMIFTDFCKTFGELFAINQSKVETLGYAYVAFYDLRYAIRAFEELPKLQWGHGIRAEFVQVNEFQRVCFNNGLENIRLCTRSKAFVICGEERCNIGDTVMRKASAYGGLMNFTQLQNSFVCDFYDIRAAANFATSFPFGQLGGVNVRVELGFEEVNNNNNNYNKRVDSATQSLASSNSTDRTSGSISTMSSVDYGQQERNVKNTLLKSSLTNGEGNIEESLKHGSLDFQTDDVNDQELGIVTKADVPRNNVVDLRRIAKGLDTRTTLMLRNIPNKVDQTMLKEYIDITNANTYDFLYLRIDFANKCNVGYAFISFIAPEYIITFAKSRSGTKWNRFNSEKICDISYANIQGKECLVEKFRNSSVMDQNPAYRPRVFYSEGDKVGQEQDFPAPNNINRKLRSIVSVQRVGLFPPQSETQKGSSNNRTATTSKGKNFGNKKKH